MKKLFDVDGPVMTALGYFSNIVILSVLWLLCSIPVVTVGASTSALYYVTLKLARGEVSGVAGPFFKAMKDNLKAGVAFTLIFGAAGTVLYLDYMMMLRVTGVFGTVLRVVFMALGFCCLITALYTFPLQAQFVNTITGTLKNAFAFSVRNMRTTLLMLVIHALPLLVVFLSLQALLRILPFLFLLLPGLIARLCSVLIMKIFRPLMEQAAQENPATELP